MNLEIFKNRTTNYVFLALYKVAVDQQLKEQIQKTSFHQTPLQSRYYHIDSHAITNLISTSKPTTLKHTAVSFTQTSLSITRLSIFVSYRISIKRLAFTVCLTCLVVYPIRELRFGRKDIQNFIFYTIEVDLKACLGVPEII